MILPDETTDYSLLEKETRRLKQKYAGVSGDGSQTAELDAIRQALEGLVTRVTYLEQQERAYSGFVVSLNKAVRNLQNDIEKLKP